MAKYTKQELFDRAVGGVIPQGGPAFDGRCRYRGPNGTRCPVGHVMSDHYYRTGMEGNEVHFLCDCLQYKVPHFFRENSGMFSILQSIHDELALKRLKGSSFIHQFKAQTKKIAIDEGLRWNF